MTYCVRATDAAALDRLLERQRAHPTVDGMPSAARIPGLPLFIGDANAAQDVFFLEANHITHILSLGTGNISPQSYSVLEIDILDMDDQLIVLHFAESIQFLKRALADTTAAALVHCVYGQSRSATICVSYLMAELKLPMVDAYDIVQRVRPCVYINPGFLKQLQLFERMDNDANLLGTSNAHAELRGLLAAKARAEEGTVQLLEMHVHRAQTYNCAKCNVLLCSRQNEILHGDASASLDRTCTAIYIEPMTWMSTNPRVAANFVLEKKGKLCCPKCPSKLGCWSWVGLKCQCGVFVAPAFQLVSSRVRYRSA